MEILTGDQMRNIDRRAIEEFGIPSLTLMESAGKAVAEMLLADHPDASAQGILIVCGKGNNGGDGLVVARHLQAAGIAPQVVVLAAGDALSPDAAHNLRSARDSGLSIHHAVDERNWSRLEQQTAGCGIVVDALLGTGIRGGARGLAAKVIERLNAAGSTGRRVIAIDLPSGLDADVGQVAGSAVRAALTYTLCRPKRALVLPPASEHSLAFKTLDIGIPDAAVAAEGPALEWVDTDAARRLLPCRLPGAHKGDFGHLLAVAGSPGKSGAAVLLARAALRAGVGLVTVAAPRAIRSEIAVQQAEIMTEPLDATEAGTLNDTAHERIGELAARCGTLALGPGLGTEPSTVAAVKRSIARRTVPAVLDADGLNAFAGALDRLRADDDLPPLVLTPHPGEAARLLQTTVARIQADRLGSALELAGQSAAYVVLKGRHTLMAAPDGRAAVNSTGNPGMASAGSGDVLTGILGALLARRLPVWDAVRLGVWLHGASGDRGAAALGHDGLIASDLIENLPLTLAGLNPR